MVPAGVRMGAKTYRDLVFWQLCNELRKKVVAITSREPGKSNRRFCDHFREAISSACSGAAEGFGRRTHAEFAQFMGIARGSVMETQDKLDEALESGYVTKAEYDDMFHLANRAIGAATKLIVYLEGGTRYPRRASRSTSRPTR
jgi:four helix bundle protein